MLVLLRQSEIDKNPKNKGIRKLNTRRFSCINEDSDEDSQDEEGSSGDEKTPQDSKN